MAAGNGKHADTRPRHGTGASRDGDAQRFLDAATLRHTLAPSSNMPGAQGLVCLLPRVRAFGTPRGMPRAPRCQRDTLVSARSMPGWTA